VDNEVVIRVRAEDDTSKGFDSIKAKAKKFSEDVERDLKQSGNRSGRSLADGIGDGMDAARAKTTRAADKLGDDVVQQMKQAGRKAGDQLGDGIADGFGINAPDILVSAHTLAEDIEDEFKIAGKRAGASLSEGISEGMDAAGAGGEGLGEKIVPKIKKVGEKAGKAAGESFTDTFGAIIGDLGRNPYVIGGLAGVGVLAAPLIGGLLAAAVIGGAGSLGIVGGFVAAAGDSRVKGAAIALKDLMSDDLEDAADSFVPAAVGAIGQVRTAWTSMLPDIESIFKQSGGLLDPLIGGVVDGVEMMVDGIEVALGGAGPVFESFGDLFREVGGALGDMFAGLSDNGETAAAALDFLAAALVATVDALWIFMEASSVAIDAIRPIGGLIADAVNATDEWISSLGGVGGQSEEVAGKQGVLKRATEEGTAATQAQRSALRELEEEMRKQTDPLFAVFDLQVKNTKAQEDYNKSLEENGPNAAKTRKALLDMGKASFELTSALTNAADEGFNGKLTPAMRNALRNAGNTTGQIDALERELIAAWRAANKWSGTYTQTYITRYKEYGLKSPSAGGGFQGLATGGIVGAATGGMHGGMRMVGEAGPELIDLPAGTQVHSAPDTARMMSGQSSAGGSLAGGKLEIILKFDPSHAPEAIRGMMEGIRAEVRDTGGSVQVSLGVAGVAA